MKNLIFHFTLFVYFPILNNFLCADMFINRLYLLNPFNLYLYFINALAIYIIWFLYTFLIHLRISTFFLYLFYDLSINRVIQIIIPTLFYIRYATESCWIHI
jgi:hypothetical protein